MSAEIERRDPKYSKFVYLKAGYFRARLPSRSLNCGNKYLVHARSREVDLKR